MREVPVSSLTVTFGPQLLTFCGLDEQPVSRTPRPLPGPGPQVFLFLWPLVVKSFLSYHILP